MNGQISWREEKFSLRYSVLILITAIFLAVPLRAFDPLPNHPDTETNLIITVSQLGTQIKNLKLPELSVESSWRLPIIDFSKLDFIAPAEKLLPIVIGYNIDGYAKEKEHEQAQRADSMMQGFELLGELTFGVLASRHGSFGAGQKLYDGYPSWGAQIDTDPEAISQRP